MHSKRRPDRTEPKDGSRTVNRRRPDLVSSLVWFQLPSMRHYGLSKSRQPLHPQQLRLRPVAALCACSPPIPTTQLLGGHYGRAKSKGFVPKKRIVTTCRAHTPERIPIHFFRIQSGFDSFTLSSNFLTCFVCLFISAFTPCSPGFS
jgi:hypothetical protein